MADSKNTASDSPWETWQPHQPMPERHGSPERPWDDIDFFDWPTAAALWLDQDPDSFTDPPASVVARIEWLRVMFERLGFLATIDERGSISRFELLYLARLLDWRPAFLFLPTSTDESESVVPAAQSSESLPADRDSGLLEERKACLANWLEARSIPPEDWRSLGKHGLSVNAIYTAMTQKREFRSLSGIGDPITFKTFERQFWKKQSEFKIQ